MLAFVNGHETLSSYAVGLDATKATCSSPSRSTSAGSSPSRESVDIQKSLEDASLQDTPSPCHRMHVAGLPDYDYPTPWSVERSNGPLEAGFPSAVIVKNTFLGVSTQRSPSLDGFFESRKVKSCPPASGISLPPGLEEVVTTEEAMANLASYASTHDELEIAADDELQASNYRWCTYLPNGLLESPAARAHEQETQEASILTLDLMQALSSPPHAARRDQNSVSGSVATLVPPSTMHLPQVLAVQVGTAQCPTVGSQGHWFGTCKPCVFLHTKGCMNGINCSFCHLCEAGEKKKRAKEQRALRRCAKIMAKAYQGP